MCDARLDRKTRLTVSTKATMNYTTRIARRTIKYATLFTGLVRRQQLRRRR